MFSLFLWNLQSQRERYDLTEEKKHPSSDTSVISPTSNVLLWLLEKEEEVSNAERFRGGYQRRDGDKIKRNLHINTGRGTFVCKLK